MILHHASRRQLLSMFSTGVSAAALASLLEDVSASEEHRQPEVQDLTPRQSHFSATAKNVIHLFMNGGPSQMDLLDPKPELDRNHGKSYFDRIAGEVENPGAAGALMRSPFRFAQYGQSGLWVSDVMPHLATCVDDIAVVKSLHTTNLTHEPALYHFHSGNTLPGLPTLGAWVTYGLGSENQNLPAYVVLDDPAGLPINRTQNWQSGFLPPVFQGTRFRATGQPVLDLKPEFDEPASVTGLERTLIGALDRLHQARRAGNPELSARIASYELAGRMQLAASDALDLNQETQETQASYGIGVGATDSYGRRCLIARRLVERGVRFVQIFLDAQPWDNHTGLKKGLEGCCARTDQPIAALLRDLKARGLLESTLVIWGGEFGRLPIAQSADGRDHNKNAMVGWMAGGGVKGGISYGETDEIGYAAAQDKVSVTDWHATMLHLLGLDFDRLSWYRNGLEEKLTGVNEARVIHEIIA